MLGAYSLSEPHAGSDPAAMATSARLDGDHYVLNGTKAWVTHGGYADFYTVMAVSYTHLDVYKRQKQHRSFGCPMSARG